MSKSSNGKTTDFTSKPVDNGSKKAKENEKLSEMVTRTAWKAVANTTIEPVMFLHAASMTMIYLIAQSLKVYKVCRGTFGHSIEVCRNLSANHTLEEESQRVASDLGMYWAIIQTVPSTVLTVFLGTWSDMHGRKIPMILPLAGAALSGVVLVIAAYFEELPAEFLLLSPALAGLSGGMSTLVVAVFSYVSDISTEKSRTIRMGFVTGMWFLGSPVGSVLAGVLITYTNYVTVFSLGSAILVVCLIYVHFRIKDNIPNKKLEATIKKSIWKEICSCSNYKDSFITALKKRPDHKRSHLWLLIFCMCALFLPVIGEGNVRYLYTRYKFEWKDSTYTYYVAAQMATGAVVVICVLPIMTKKLKMKDVDIAVLGIIARVISELIVAFSSVGWMMFLSPITLLGECAGPPLRSLMTKCVQPNEVGKMFTMLAVVEAGIPIISGVMYSQVYNATIDIHCCGIVFLITAFVYITVIIVLFWLRYDMHKVFVKNMNNLEELVNQTNGNKLNIVEQDKECSENKIAKLAYDNDSFEPVESVVVVDDEKLKTSHL